MPGPLYTAKPSCATRARQGSGVLVGVFVPGGNGVADGITGVRVGGIGVRVGGSVGGCALPIGVGVAGASAMPMPEQSPSICT